MLKKTVQLFIKACIIGILINIGLAQVPATSTEVEEDVAQQIGIEIFREP